MSPRRRLAVVLQRPDQGWSSLLLLLGLLVVLGLSIADARPLVLGGVGDSATGSLVTLMLAAGLIGFLLARSSLGTVRAHIVGAAVAAGLLLLVAGAALSAGTPPLPLQPDELTERISAVWLRLDADVTANMADPKATPTMATYLVLGAICWTTAQFSAFSIFRYDRGGPAVMAIGAVLFLNVGLGALDPEADALPVVPLLAAFSALSMLLLMRLQLTQQRQQWTRRHIADTGEVSRLFLRSGVLFVVLTVLSASSLTVWATVDAPKVDLGDLEEPMEDIGEGLSRWLRILGVPAPTDTPTTIEDTWTVEDLWKQPNETAFTATVEGQLRGNYWWGWAHDHFDGQTWDRDKRDSLSTAAGEPMPVTPLASASGDHALTTSITVESTGMVQGMAFRPAEASVVFRDVEAYVVDDGGGIGDVTYDEPLEPGDTVRLEAWVRDYSQDASSLTANELRRAGTDYPEWVRDRYLQGTEVEISGELAGQLADEIEVDSHNPYDQAIELQSLLQDMAYTPNMQGVCDPEDPIPDCVLREKRGFCQHYATTMAMVLRAMDVPSRVVTGYLRGDRVDETWVVEQAAFHNWVEAWFPEHGWVRFDPTPRGDDYGLTPTRFPPGPVNPPSPQPSELPLQSPGPSVPELLEDTPEPAAGAGTTETPRDDLGSTLFIGGGLVLALLVVVVGLLFFRFRRLSDGDGGLAYRGIVSLATRLGYGPHASQTEYEYAGTLSEVIPSVRDDLYVVADARVETAYGQREIDSGRRGALRRAYARIRTALLRLSLGRRQ